MVNVKFWKKDKGNEYERFEGIGRGGALGPASEPFMSSSSSSGYPQDNLGLPGVPTQSMSSGNEIEIIKKDIEILNSKMDSLKSFLEAINQKLYNIERKLNTEGGSSEPSWHY